MLLMMVAALAAQQGGMTSQSSAPPPVVIAPSLPPPIVAVPSTPPPMLRIAQPAEPRVIVAVHVRVAAGRQMLFDDTLRIARNAGASFTQSRSEAPVRLCATERYYGYGERESLNLQLNLREDPEAGPAVAVSVNWQRPSGTAACGPDGTRAVSLTESVPLKPGQSATLQGDAGLTVTLSRR